MTRGPTTPKVLFWIVFHICLGTWSIGRLSASLGLLHELGSLAHMITTMLYLTITFLLLSQGSSIPAPNAYHAAPKVASPGLYTPKRAGRLESLKDINDI